MYIIIKEQAGAFQVTQEIVAVIRIADFALPSGIGVSQFTQEGGILVGTGSGTFIEKSPGADGKYLKYDSTQAGGVTADIPSFEVEDTTNHLINGGFNFAQRQAPGTLTTIADGGYSADRWKVTRENADIQFIRQDGSSEAGLVSPYYGQFKKITNAGKFLVCQPLEYLDTLKFRGRSISFQLQMKASTAKTIKIAVVELQAAGTADTLPTLVSSWGADSTDPTLGANLVAIDTPVACAVTTDWGTFQFTGTFPADSKNLLVMVWSDADFAANDTLSMAEAGVYYGTTQIAWTARQYAVELLLCNRYYWKTFRLDTAPATNIGINLGDHIFSAPAAGAVALRSPIYLPVPMRNETITLTLYNPAAANNEVRDVTGGLDCASSTCGAQTAKYIVINATGNAGSVVNDRMSVHVTAENEL
jgi:hypothetical protein